MASGDTKTEALLNILGHGGSVDGITGSGNTKTQDYLVDAIGRIQGIENDVEELKNNPDVVDIVDTYADLQAYDTSHLTDKDVIRVLADETHGGNSAYYRFTKSSNTWTFIGEVSGGDLKELTAADYNYTYAGSQRVALWLLKDGLYYVNYDGPKVMPNSNVDPTDNVTSYCHLFFITSDSQYKYITMFSRGKGTYNNKLGVIAAERVNKTDGSKVGMLYDAIPSTQVNNNLTTTSSGYVLDARQGKVLKDLVDANAGSLILYANAAEITDGGTIQFYDAADLDHSVSIGTIHAAVSSGRDIKIIARNSIEDDFSERTIYTIYKAYYPKTCTDESMNETGMTLYVIGGLGTNASVRKAIRFQTFSGPAYDNFAVGIESF